MHGAKEICWYVHVNVVGGSMMEQKKKQWKVFHTNYRGCFYNSRSELRVKNISLSLQVDSVLEKLSKVFNSVLEIRGLWKYLKRDEILENTWNVLEL